MALAFVMAAPNVRLCIANDGEQARTYLSGFERYADRDAYPIPQLILLDLDLPRNSGLEILKWLRAKPALKHIPVVVLTSSGQSGNVDRAYQLGANSCILESADDDAMYDVARGIGDYAALLKNRIFGEFSSYEAASDAACADLRACASSKLSP